MAGPQIAMKNVITKMLYMYQKNAKTFNIIATT
jgi:hypothetical protein